MCYILLSTCTLCTWTLRIRYARCTHAHTHSLDPVACPNRMKRRRQSDGGLCGKCEARRGSLSLPPRRAMDSQDAGNENEHVVDDANDGDVRAAKDETGIVVVDGEKTIERRRRLMKRRANRKVLK
ncbi:hypothetical protein EK21DRAFT_91098 [Setomelanomma holmii]|uniref:Uncharacterized protein n=1 Tax=Setomelanomma holmii TaxID=210430 RepID=A0A9P4LKQ9_9PLEO|nr:hypothetical protein EK21DRAFT_91098 [Setomelanomma holmii]